MSCVISCFKFYFVLLVAKPFWAVMQFVRQQACMLLVQFVQFPSSFFFSFLFVRGKINCCGYGGEEFVVIVIFLLHSCLYFA